ncbi:MAG: 2-isopropylmalate synthase [Lachnospiraceae bacterium]|nr:2-isopropylmalate synthase [Lachnospiraceae bacterium]
MKLLLKGNVMNYERYAALPAPDMKGERSWPGRRLQEAPIWCSVDLRDGNQALTDPMTVEGKLEFFKLLVKMGFKEIEVGFPSASGIEFDFVRELLIRKLVPADVKIQVLSQCREHLIRRTFEAVEGADNIIFHIYNNTSDIQRHIVYDLPDAESLDMGAAAASLVKKLAAEKGIRVTLEYSPESFTESDPDFVRQTYTRVIEVWKPSHDNPMILDFPTTVENLMPNEFADRMELIARDIAGIPGITLSIHPHNDRGTGVASAELAMLAGAKRIEGTLFGNGERAGNVDILNIACNLLARGIDPKLDISNILDVRKKYEHLTGMRVPERYPYAGDLVFTAFSGGHQDAINKVLAYREKEPSKIWDIPYLPIDPADIGRIYESFVRINSLSGRGGVAYVLEVYHGFKLPRDMRGEFSQIIQVISENEGEVDPERIMTEFKKNYMDKKEPYHFKSINTTDEPTAIADNFLTVATLSYTDHGELKTVTAKGNGPIDAAKTAISQDLKRSLRILDYSEHALTSGSNAQAAAYIHLFDSETGRSAYGVGVSSSTTRASIRAIFSALNRIEEEN